MSRSTSIWPATCTTLFWTAVAIRADAVLVHQDRDFERIAAVAADLRCVQL